MARILVVDDEKSIRITLREFLKEDGHDVQVVEDAQSAMELLGKEAFDVVVTDIILPKVTGVDLLKTIREISPYVQVIMMTGEPTVDTASESLRAGAFDYLYKPISKEAILKTTNNAVTVKQLEDEKRRLEAENLRHREELERLVEERTKSLRESEETARALLNSSPDAAMLIDIEGKILALNIPMIERLGSKEKELIGKCFYDYLPDAIAEIRKNKTQEVIRSKSPLYFQDVREERVLDNRLFPVFDEEGNVSGISFFSRDITEFKRLEAMHIRLATAIEQSAESIVITDKDGNIQYVNPAFEKTTGYCRDKVMGKNPRFLKSGKQDPTFYQSMWEDLRNGKVWDGHFINRKKDGTLYEEDASISPVKDESGTITHYVAVKRDVTDQIKLWNQLQQAQKMEALGALAGGIAHDFNNILFPIVGYTEMSMGREEPESITHKNLAEVLRAAQRANSLVKQILAFSRQAEQEPKPVQVKLIVKEVLKLIRASLPTTIEIRQNISSHSAIFADPVEIHQVLMNLITNAYHAMREKGGVLEIELKDFDVRDNHLADKLQIASGHYILLKVSDTGSGIDKMILSKIFDPYFTTKEKGEGTGLGLATVHGIVTSLNGRIMVDSEPGKGTTFTVYLPQLDESVDRLEEISREPLPSGHERILLVDDEESICNMLQQMLERLGYSVTALTNSYEALAEFKNRSDEFDILITDMTMPGLTGLELAQQFISTRPDFPVVLFTGYSELINKDIARKAGIREFIVKPLLTRDLCEAIRRALDRK